MDLEIRKLEVITDLQFERKDKVLKNMVVTKLYGFFMIMSLKLVQ